jgi:hypothetical protein
MVPLAAGSFNITFQLILFTAKEIRAMREAELGGLRFEASLSKILVRSYPKS